ncbi:MBL fold metallo-hydrolase [Patulibacter brassicae]|uniref:MBL fold metallo-hydrolase n=1 Tax=Patulibacter brassicae TaxID=1705717 RepID=A0ABU4VQN9_9ACTN|nr:MBL fold metallo-hydrolase [Patulibacter brassicae]MDX8153677.1 MBL fold metallo-hydrolase [Patulibacter brassicae]
MDVRMFTLGMIQENAFLVRRPEAREAVIVDPGDEAPKLLAAFEELGVTLAGILVTHAHFDHIGAVADLHDATGAEVWCPEGELEILRDPNAVMRWEGFGPFRGYEAEHPVKGGDVVSLAGFDFQVVSTPGHSPDHVTYALPDEGALFSGDVLFQGSVGRTDLPGADHATLMRSIAGLLERFDDATAVYPGHMGPTTLGQERRTNPFLLDLQGA